MPRWKSPTLGDVTPDDFVPVAEFAGHRLVSVAALDGGRFFHAAVPLDAGEPADLPILRLCRSPCRSVRKKPR